MAPAGSRTPPLASVPRFAPPRPGQTPLLSSLDLHRHRGIMTSRSMSISDQPGLDLGRGRAVLPASKLARLAGAGHHVVGRPAYVWATPPVGPRAGSAAEQRPVRPTSASRREAPACPTCC